MAGGASPAHFSNIVAFLATAGVAVPLFKRLKISPVLGFLGAGVALGPQGLGRLVPEAPWLDYFTVTQPQQIADLAELGVVFLLFMIGLELSWERLRLMRRMVFGLGALQVAICAGLITAIGMGFGLPLAAALAAGAALALSSTAIAVPVLSEGGRLHSPSGRAAFAILLFQDIAVAPILVALAVMGRGGGGSGPGALVTLGTAALGLVVIFVAGRLLLRPLFRSAARAKSQELFMAASLLVVIGAGLIASLLGLSMALGAFIAGILLAETEYRHQVEVMIEPFKGLLLGLFFLSIGIGLDLGLLAAQPLQILGAAAGLIALKTLAILLLCRLFRLKWSAALEAGLLLGTGGEFAFVVLNQALGSGIIGREAAQALQVSATVSLFALPALGWLGAQLTRRSDGRADVKAVAEPAPGAEPRVLIVGYGRVGRLVGDMLAAHDLPWLSVERDSKLVEAARREGKTVYFGDASRAELLERLGLETAPALVVTMDAPEVVEAVTATARRLRPDLIIVARARDARQAKKLYDLGATDAVPETIEASLQLSEAVLVHIGVPMGLIIASIHEKRDEIRNRLNLPLPAPSRVRRRPSP
jgi:CPA2 family monovalent cation:H+ antiporter-2